MGLGIRQGLPVAEGVDAGVFEEASTMDHLDDLGQAPMPGLRQQMPRTMRSICTPAALAS